MVISSKSQFDDLIGRKKTNAARLGTALESRIWKVELTCRRLRTKGGSGEGRLCCLPNIIRCHLPESDNYAAKS
jgi:hypothetical protein